MSGDSAGEETPGTLTPVSLPASVLSATEEHPARGHEGLGPPGSAMMEQPRKPQEWGPSVGSPQPALLYGPGTRDPGQS